MIHVRYDGKSDDFTQRELGLRANASDQEVKRCVETRLDLPGGHLSFYVVDRPHTGDIVVRPEAVYG